MPVNALSGRMAAIANPTPWWETPLLSSGATGQSAGCQGSLLHPTFSLLSKREKGEGQGLHVLLGPSAEEGCRIPKHDLQGRGLNGSVRSGAAQSQSLASPGPGARSVAGPCAIFVSPVSGEIYSHEELAGQRVLHEDRLCVEGLISFFLHIERSVVRQNVEIEVDRTVAEVSQSLTNRKTSKMCCKDGQEKVCRRAW